MAREDRDYERGGAKRTLPLAATSFLLSAAHQRSLRNMYFQPRQSFIWGPALRDMEGKRERVRGTGEYRLIPFSSTERREERDSEGQRLTDTWR